MRDGINEKRSSGSIIGTRHNLAIIGTRHSLAPAGGLFKIQSPINILFYSVRNIYGSMVISNKTNNQQLTVDISRFPKGVYLLELQRENGEIIAKKILKQ